MPADRLHTVRAEFGDPLPAGLDGLADAELRDLGSALAEARDKQSQALDAAIDRALRVLPWPLRVVVRKVLVG